ncbi:MAG: DUF5668 domain-containing protein [Bacteroidota bacterium]|nr:DUF5668 domain-containing protein [Bacteroidota bacterium]
METKSFLRTSPQFIVGLLIIGLGVAFMLDNLGYVDAGQVIRFWPALLVLFGIGKVVQSPGSPGRIFGTILIFVGGMMLLDRLDVITFHLHDWWPVILIIIGVNFLRGSWNRSNTFSRTTLGGESADAESYIKHFAVMSGVKRSVTSKDFRGGELSALMGGCELDFREAAIKEDQAVLDVFTMMGGIELRVPMDWTVVVQATPIMGGIDDKTYLQPEAKPTKKLIITGTVIMGGIEIKN